MPPHQDLCLNSKQTRQPVIVSTEYMYIPASTVSQKLVRVLQRLI